MNWIYLTVGGLVTWRIANIIAKQKGPLDVFVRLRAILARGQKRSGGLYDMFSCVTCVSMYIGALTAIQPSTSVLTWLAYTLSFSAIASVLEAFVSREK